MKKIRYFLGGRLFPCAALCVFTAAAIIALALWLPCALAPIALAERLFSFGAALFTVCSSDEPECKLPKVVLIVLLPWTGAILALVWRRKKPFAENPPRAEICYADSLDYFPVGRDMYERLLDDVSAARKFIWLEYYIVAHGAFFYAVEELLERKAKEGLDVRLLYDDFGCSLTLPGRFEKDLAKRGIKTRAIRKVRFPSRAANRRNHRKIAVIDGEIAYTGGMNLADEYIGEKIRFGHWKDTAVRVTGAPALQFARLVALDAKTELPGLPEPRAGKIPCAVIADKAADTVYRAGVSALCTLVHSAEEYAYLNTPYLAPDKAATEALISLARAGKDVRIMIPYIPDKRTTFLITKSYARELMRAGVRIRQYTAGFLHAKSLVSDGLRCFVSTYNLDFRSFHLQAECGLYAEDEETAACMKRDFLSAWEAGTPLNKAGFFERALGSVLRLFAPLV